mmetsp:Transcript_31430/g.69269  ORF Transcript_31430/g.69269 Transcript_31430/m.69269 type:complete len:267 (-) Transcript_31430:26-826(-)
MLAHLQARVGQVPASPREALLLRVVQEQNRAVFDAVRLQQLVQVLGLERPSAEAVEDEQVPLPVPRRNHHHHPQRAHLPIKLNGVVAQNGSEGFLPAPPHGVALVPHLRLARALLRTRLLLRAGYLVQPLRLLRLPKLVPHVADNVVHNVPANGHLKYPTLRGNWRGQLARAEELPHLDGLRDIQRSVRIVDIREIDFHRLIKNPLVCECQIGRDRVSDAAEVGSRGALDLHVPSECPSEAQHPSSQTRGGRSGSSTSWKDRWRWT